jgi:2-polyprenyl-6-methoxyphenol hydroxylase-like FAD-dependent oxidoreductase
MGDTVPDPRSDNTKPFPRTVAIIGASISGLSLALALLHANLFRPDDVTIYDLRPSPSTSSTTISPSTNSGFDPSTTASGVILTPNGLSVLSNLGVLPRIKPRCWTATHRTFRSDPGDTLVKKARISGKEAGYGFENHRVWRSVLVEELLRMVDEAGVRVRWSRKFEGIVSEGEEIDGGSEAGVSGAVRFRVTHRNPQFPERSHSRVVGADFLVGADGIYSAVRKHLDPNAQPVYTGTTGVLAHIRWDDVDWPKVTSPGMPELHPYERQCTLQGTPGALFWLPEDAAGSVIMVGKQTRMAEPKPTDPSSTNSQREAWERLSQDKDFLCKFYREGYEQWGATGRKIIDAVCDEDKGRGTLYLWPFMRMERLKRWWKSVQNVTEAVDDGQRNGSSEPTPTAEPPGVILLLGDAAHALPPSSGQGVNQTLEDVWVLTRLLALVKQDQTSGKTVQQALTFWQEVRQERIDEVYDWATNATNISRLPKGEREKAMMDHAANTNVEQRGEGQTKKVAFSGDDMSWLYVPCWDKVIERWAKS